MSRLSASELASLQDSVRSSVGRRGDGSNWSGGDGRHSAGSGRGASSRHESHRGSRWSRADVNQPDELELATQHLKPSSRLVINHISVYIPDGDGWRVRLLRSAARLLMSPHFDTAMGLVIVANSVTIGFELSYRLERVDTAAIEDLEHFFLVVYSFELALRGYVMRSRCLKDKSVLFDLLLVCSGVLITWVLRPLNLHDIEGGVAPGMLAVLRTLRLLRLARTVRLLVKFRELWMLVRSLMNSASTMMYTCVLMTIILYILACMGVELVSLHTLATDIDPNPHFISIVDEHFRTVGLTMVTLVQFVCLDSIASIYKPLIELDAFLSVYFLGSILVVGIVLMNLITAVVVNSAMEQATQDKEAMANHANTVKEKLLKDLRKLFLRLDEDGSGQVNREEITQGITEGDKAMLEMVMCISDPVEVFDALDVDESGELDIDEFCAGIWQVAMSKTPIEIKRIEKQLHGNRDQLRAMASSLASIKQKLVALEATLGRRAETKAPGSTAPVMETKAHTNTPSIAGSAEANVETGGVPSAGGLEPDYVQLPSRLKPTSGADGLPDYVQLPPGGLLDQLAFLIRRAVRDEFVLLSEPAANDSRADARSARPRPEKLGAVAAHSASASGSDLLPAARRPHWGALPALPASSLEAPPARASRYVACSQGASTPPRFEAPTCPATPPNVERLEASEALETWLADELNSSMAPNALSPRLEIRALVVRASSASSPT